MFRSRAITFAFVVSVACLVITPFSWSQGAATAQTVYPRLLLTNNLTFSIDDSTGYLRLVGRGLGPGVAAFPDGRFLFEATDAQGIAVFTANSLGQIVQTSYLSLPNAFELSSLVVDRLGKFLFVTDISANTVWALTIDGTSGQLTIVPGSPFATGGSPLFLTVSPADRFLYVSNYYSNSISAFTIDSTTGALGQIAGSPFSMSQGNSLPGGLVADRTGEYLYVEGASVDGFKITSTGSLKLLKESPFSGAGTGTLTVDPLGTFLYGAGSENIDVYMIDESTGAISLTRGSPFQGARGTLVADPSGKYLYSGSYGYQLNRSDGSLLPLNSVADDMEGFLGSEAVILSGARPVNFVPLLALVANSGSNTLTSYAINKASGELSRIGSAATGRRPVFVASSRKFVYVANFQSNSVSGYEVNSNGTLSELVGSPFPTPFGPTWIAIDNFGTNVFVANAGDVTVFDFDNTTGALSNPSSGDFVSHCGSPNSIVLNTDASIGYASCGLDWAAFQFTKPVNGGAFEFATSISSLTMSASGTTAFGVGKGSLASLSAYDYTVGIYSLGPPENVSGGVTLEPSERFGYAMETSNGAVQGIDVVDPWSLTPLPGSPFVAGSSPVAGAVDISGRFLYVVNSVSNNVSCYGIDQTTGSLTPLAKATVPTGNAPFSITTIGTIR